jgi:hypothetical protein
MACCGWLAFSVTGLLLPTYENQVFTIGQALTLGELVTMLWLVIMGAKEQRLTAVHPEGRPVPPIPPDRIRASR